jgi:hypothetical protein
MKNTNIVTIGAIGITTLFSACSNYSEKADMQQIFENIQKNYDKIKSFREYPEFQEAVIFLLNSPYGKELSQIEAETFTIKAIQEYGLQGGINTPLISILKIQIEEIYLPVLKNLNKGPKEVFGESKELISFNNKNDFLNFLENIFSKEIAEKIKKEVNKKSTNSSQVFSLNINTLNGIFFKIDNNSYRLHINKEKLLKDFLYSLEKRETYYMTPEDLVKIQATTNNEIGKIIR